MSVRGGLIGHAHESITEIAPEVWDRLLPGEAERHAYYRAVEAAPPPAFRFGAVSVRHYGETVAVAPTFSLTYRLDTPLQGRWRSLGNWLHRRVPGIVNLPVLGLGSPLADRCHLGISSALSEVEATQALGVLLETLAGVAARQGAKVLAIKDITEREAGPAHPALSTQGYARISSLPVAVLDLPFKDEEAYLASLSPATRKDIRRKLKAARAVRVELRTDIEDVSTKIVELYDATRGQSGVDYGDFELLSPGYFTGVMRALGPDAAWMLYWLGDELIGFNLLLVEKDRVIDKFIGMRYPLAREMNLYAVSWMANVRFCLERGIAKLQTGQTAYTSKVRYGSRLDPCFVYFRHVRPGINRLFRTFGPMLAFDKLDPELKALAKRGRLDWSDVRRSAGGEPRTPRPAG